MAISPSMRGRLWRFASPSMLLLALLLFPLPWIEIQCKSVAGSPPLLSRIGVPKPVAEVITPSQTVAGIIGERMWITILMNFIAFGLMYVIAIPIGIVGAAKQFTIWDRILTIIPFLLVFVAEVLEL